MKKILGLTVAALMVMGLVGGGTWAYFSDPESSTGNVITAGKLNLAYSTTGTFTGDGTFGQTDGGDGVNGYYTFGSVEPGDTGTITWVLTNDSDIAGNLTVAANFTFTDGVAANEPEGAVSDPYSNNDGGDGDLDEFVGVKLQRGTGVDQTAAEAAFTYIVGAAGYYSELETLEPIFDAETFMMTADGGTDDVVVYKLSFAVATDIIDAGPDEDFLSGGDDGTADDNIIQGDTCAMDFTFTLTQE